ncbi:MAG: DUF502 domain-containing protein [Candidatus Omnitrophica bacterium]|nr:DUF502 domain-containing protein [Candidatus Omnitrophota bacterium]
METEKKAPFTFAQNLRNFFFSGIAIIFPMAVSIYLFVLIFKTLDAVLGKIVNTFLYDNFGYRVPGIGIVLGIIIILLIGVMASHYVGKRFFPMVEDFIKKLPLLRHIYSPAKQLSDFIFSSSKGMAFNRVVMVPFPNDFSYSIGFMTNDDLNEIDNKIGKKMVAILVSTTPSPFSGPIIFLPLEKVIQLDLNMEEGIKLIVSGGLVSPERYRSKKTT